MRSEEELRNAMLVMGASFTGDLRRIIWGNHPEAEREAWGGFLALGWAAGADNAFSTGLEYASLKLSEYMKKETNDEHP